MILLTKIIIGLIITVLVIPLLIALPTITIPVDAAINSNIYSYFRAAMYFLPSGTVVLILSLILALWIFRIIVAVIKAFWEILPFV